ncbi:MAG: hypothetical protein KDD43_07170, partial [Bdellovibrionales bacterium]|nr:hypothetical protein [Bdellovibrionales bacterium]
RSLYVDFAGDVWPCCWIGAPVYFFEDEVQKRELRALINRYGKRFNSLHQHGIDEILDHRFFTNDLERSWVCGDESRLYTCGRTCGGEFEFTSFPGYGNNRLVRFVSE